MFHLTTSIVKSFFYLFFSNDWGHDTRDDLQEISILISEIFPKIFSDWSRVAFEFEYLKCFIGYSLHTFGKRVTTIPSTMVHVSPPSLTAAALASFEMSYISFVNSLAIPNVLPNPIGDILVAASRPILKKRNIDEEWKRGNINISEINEFVEIKINYSIIKIRYECKNMNQYSNYFRFFKIIR